MEGFTCVLDIFDESVSTLLLDFLLGPTEDAAQYPETFITQKIILKFFADIRKSLGNDPTKWSQPIPRGTREAVLDSFQRILGRADNLELLRRNLPFRAHRHLAARNAIIGLVNGGPIQVSELISAASLHGTRSWVRHGNLRLLHDHRLILRRTEIGFRAVCRLWKQEFQRRDSRYRQQLYLLRSPMARTIAGGLMVSFNTIRWREDLVRSAVYPLQICSAIVPFGLPKLLMQLLGVDNSVNIEWSDMTQLHVKKWKRRWHLQYFDDRTTFVDDVVFPYITGTEMVVTLKNVPGSQHYVKSLPSRLNEIRLTSSPLPLRIGILKLHTHILRRVLSYLVEPAFWKLPWHVPSDMFGLLLDCWHQYQNHSGITTALAETASRRLRCLHLASVAILAKLNKKRRTQMPATDDNYDIGSQTALFQQLRLQEALHAALIQSVQSAFCNASGVPLASQTMHCDLAKELASWFSLHQVCRSLRKRMEYTDRPQSLLQLEIICYRLPPPESSNKGFYTHLLGRISIHGSRSTFRETLRHRINALLLSLPCHCQNCTLLIPSIDQIADMQPQERRRLQVALLHWCDKADVVH